LKRIEKHLSPLVDRQFWSCVLSTAITKTGTPYINWVYDFYCTNYLQRNFSSSSDDGAPGNVAIAKTFTFDCNIGVLPTSVTGNNFNWNTDVYCFVLKLMRKGLEVYPTGVGSALVKDVSGTATGDFFIHPVDGRPVMNADRFKTINSKVYRYRPTAQVDPGTGTFYADPMPDFTPGGSSGRTLSMTRAQPSASFRFKTTFRDVRFENPVGAWDTITYAEHGPQRPFLWVYACTPSTFMGNGTPKVCLSSELIAHVECKH
jgi:hypothetical protein